MSAAPIFSALKRYDIECAFCGDGKPVARYYGKAACEKCALTIWEGGFKFRKHLELYWMPENKTLPVEPTSRAQMKLKISDAKREWYRLRRVVREVLGLAGPDTMLPLYERALRSRGSWTGPPRKD